MAILNTMSICGLSIICVLLFPAQAGRVRRILSGEPLESGKMPWLASIHYKGQPLDYQKLQGLGHICGGVLIQRRWVLSAAHCFDSTNLPNVSVVLGEHHRLKEERTEQVLNVEEVFIPDPYYESPLYTGDIALIKLQEPANLTQAVQTLDLDTDRNIPDGFSCRAAGWGQITNDTKTNPGYGNGTLVPHFVWLKKEKNQTCVERYGEIDIHFDDTVMCFSSKTKDSCYGDSGGPLMCEDDRGRMLLTALIRIGGVCGEGTLPSLNTRVSSYSDWIESTIDDSECQDEEN